MIRKKGEQPLEERRVRNSKRAEIAIGLDKWFLSSMATKIGVDVQRNGNRKWQAKASQIAIASLSLSIVMSVRPLR